MWKSMRVAAAICLLIGILNVSVMGQIGQLEFTNGRWFDGQSFVMKEFYTVNGILTEHRPGQIDSVINLQNKFVIPPLAEGHIHHLNDSETIDEEIRGYLAKGIFYVMVQDAMFEITADILNRVNRPNSVDVIYAQGVLIAPWYDSVLGLYTMIAEQGGFGPRTTIEELDERELFLIAEKEDFDKKWPKLRAKNKHIVKILLAFSEEYESRKSAPKEGVPGPGIDPKLLPHIIRYVHAAGLRASVHIETAADFRTAIRAGADIIAHFPGWRIGVDAGFSDGKLSRWKLSDEDAALAVQHNTVVITTTLPKTFLPNFEENQSKFTEIHSHNLRLLTKAGVKVAIGSDDRRNFVPGEIKHLAKYGVLDNLALLKMATETTPKAIFPTRNIGKLLEGYEASFLILDGNPVEDLENLNKIHLRVKQGHIIKINSN